MCTVWIHGQQVILPANDNKNDNKMQCDPDYADHEIEKQSPLLNTWSEFDAALTGAQHTFQLQPDEIQKKTCGYCKSTFESRNKLFEHLRNHQATQWKQNN